MIDLVPPYSSGKMMGLTETMASETVRLTPIEREDVPQVVDKENQGDISPQLFWLVSRSILTNKENGID